MEILIRALIMTTITTVILIVTIGAFLGYIFLWINIFGPGPISAVFGIGSGAGIFLFPLYLMLAHDEEKFGRK